VNIDAVKQEILRAHAAVRSGTPGAQHRLEVLQARFRTSGVEICRPGGSARLTEGGSAAAVTSSTKPRPKRKPTAPPPEDHHEVPELCVDATPTLTVKLGPGAKREIQTELDRASDVMLSCMETGGNLLAGQPRLRVLELVDASGPGEDDGEARRLPFGCRISARHGRERAAELRRISQDENIGFVGSWHTHPWFDPMPSEQDRIGSLLLLDDSRERRGWRAPSVWIDLILYPDEHDGWERPRLAGWGTRRLDWNGEPVTEPVRIEAG
jgi:hypothetical protein